MNKASADRGHESFIEHSYQYHHERKTQLACLELMLVSAFATPNQLVIPQELHLTKVIVESRNSNPAISCWPSLGALQGLTKLVCLFMVDYGYAGNPFLWQLTLLTNLRQAFKHHIGNQQY